jgi:hypothetical protein
MFQFNELFDEHYLRDAQAHTHATPDLIRRKPRSAAQIAASIANGRKSKGPISAKGKARSCQNAARHGILARKIAPLADHRREHDEYRWLLEGLRNEFNPRTTTAAALVELIACDLIEIGRIKQLQGCIMTAGPITEGSDICGLFVLDLQRRVDILEKVVQHTKHFCCSEEDLALLLPMIKLWQEVMTCDAAETDEPGTDDEEAGKVDPEWLELMERIKPDLLLKDDARTRSVLLGNEQIATEELQRWILLLQDILANETASLRRTTNNQSRIDRKYRHEQTKLLERLPAMETLVRLESQHRKTLERTIRQLRSQRS